MNIQDLKRNFSKQNEEIEYIKYGVFTRIAFSLLMFGLMAYLRMKGIVTPQSNPAGYALIALGFILIASHNIAIVLGSLGLPHVTAYLLVGIVSGPYGLELLPAPTVKELGLVNNLALSLIAFIAGGELRIQSLRERWRSIYWISICETVCVFGTGFIAFWFLSSQLPFLEKVPGGNAVLAVSLLFAGCIVVNSPAIAVSIINEYRPSGPMIQTAFGVIIVKDVIVVILFGFTLALAKSLTLGDAALDLSHFALEFGKEIAISIALGMAIGCAIGIYLKYIKTNLILFTAGVALLCFQIATALHLEAILLCLAAGFFVENFTKQGDAFIHHVEQIFSIVFALFFTVAGAKLNLAALPAVWTVAATLILVRAGAIYAGARLGATIAGAAPTVKKYAWLGFISQAGVALGFAVLVEQTFPGWGADLSTILVAMIGIHESVGPILFRLGLSRAGELNREQVEKDREMLHNWTEPVPESDGIW
jgi:Kef-type K+ transport system membrane component KefB